MFKLCLVLALTVVACVSGQQYGANSPEGAGAAAAAEPYSYGYQTETHAASEQRDPQGRVTGFYNIVDADGRERRVEYVADEAGFRAKIATNEVGTKSENPADVEIQASEPSPGQYAYVQNAPQPQVQYQAGPVVRQQVVQQRVQTVQQPFSTKLQYVQTQQQQQPQAVTYGSNVGYAAGGYGQGYSGQGYGQTVGYGQGYGQGYSQGYGQGYGQVYSLQNVGNYNNHLPSQYYSSLRQQSNVANPAASSGYSYSRGSYRYASQPSFQTIGVRTVTVPQGAAYTTRTASSTQGLVGSSNYQVLQKRDTDEEEKAASS